jgi:hypothetical protein
MVSGGALLQWGRNARKIELTDICQYQPKQRFPPSKIGGWQSVAADRLPGSSSK